MSRSFRAVARHWPRRPKRRKRSIRELIRILDQTGRETPIVTGRGEIYPGGIPIGRVREVDRKDNALYQTAVLEPVVDFPTLAHVLVYTIP